MSVYLRSFVFAAALAAAAGVFAEEAGSIRGVSYEEAAGMPVPAACVKTVTEDSVALEGVGCFEGSDTDLRALTLQFDAEGRLSRLEARMIEGEGFRALAEAGFVAAGSLDMTVSTPQGVDSWYRSGSRFEFVSMRSDGRRAVLLWERDAMLKGLGR